ncbi:MAG: hypothetical protein HY512_01150 [Candidatus Aenigmarchaeota archaeon]|nr:hypothetical protein [Candidatus Aenigmarchaeota archaeon]
MDILQELLKNKEQMLLKVLDYMEGRETSTKLNLSGMQFNLGNTLVKLNGEVEITVVRQKQEPKKKGRWK